MPRNQGTSRKGKPGKVENAAGMGRSLLNTKSIKQKYKPRMDGKNIYGGANGMAAIPGVTSIGINNDTNDSNNNTDGIVPILPTSTTTSTNTHPRSILELDDIDDFLYQANLAQKEFISIRGGISTSIIEQQQNIPTTNTTRKIRFADEQQQSNIDNNNTDTNDDIKIMELSVPRRPKWDNTMSKQELELLEQEAFLQWRRQIAMYEQQLLHQQQQQQQQMQQYTSMNNTGNAITNTAITPFEKNIYVWKQLWRVLERCDILIQIVDGRNPNFYISHDLIQYVTIELHKPMIVVCNKSDYLSKEQRKVWKQYFTTNTSYTGNNNNNKGMNHNNNNNITILFFSAVQEQKKLDDAAKKQRDAIILEQQIQQQQQSMQNDTDEYLLDNWHGKEDSDDDDDTDDDSDNEVEDDVDEDDQDIDDADEYNEDINEDTTNHKSTQNPISEFDDDNVIEDVDSDDYDVKLLTRDELIKQLRTIAKQYNCTPQERYDHRIQYGMVGFPNVGKSSVINVLVGNSKYIHNTVRVGVASQPGKTKHFQTLLLQDHYDIMLCDCPGLVFPSFVSNTADLIAAGVYPISQMRDYYSVIQLICTRIPRHILNAHYGIQLPVPSKQDIQDRGGGYNNSTTESYNNNNTNKIDTSIPNPTVDELLTTYCISRGLLASFSGVPDYQRAARIIVKDYADGKLLYCHPPPTLIQSVDNTSETSDCKESDAPNYQLQDFLNDTVQTALRNTQRTQ